MAGKSLSIIGCGWLGLPLAERMQARGYDIFGSTTSEEKLSILQEKGIEATLFTLGEDFDKEAAWEVLRGETLFLNIPPGRGRDHVEDAHPMELEPLLEAIEASPVSHVIFASSTSVYASTGGIVTELSEEEAEKGVGRALRTVERWLLDSPHFGATVLRFGGLVGDTRNPAKNLSGRVGLAGGNSPVNLVHLDDCLAILEYLIEQPQDGEIFNVVSDEHPPREEFYSEQCRLMGIPEPQFDQERRNLPHKIVSNEKLKATLGLKLKYPDPRTMKFR